MTEHGNSAEPEKELLTRGPSGPISLGGFIIAVWALVLLFRKGLYGGVDAWTPPSVLGVNMSVCAMIMGALAIYRVRQLAGQGLVRGGAIVALVLGMAGLPVFFAQGFHWRRSTEGMELAQLAKVAQAARAYAQAHDGDFPPGLTTMVQAGLLSPQDLLSPYRATTPLETSGRIDEQSLAGHSDYIYLGAGIHGKVRPDGWDLDPKLIVAAAKTEKGNAFDKRLGESITSVAFASGDAKYVRADEFDKVLQESNDGRKKLGLAEMDEFGKVPATTMK